MSSLRKIILQTEKVQKRRTNESKGWDEYIKEERKNAIRNTILTEAKGQVSRRRV